ncbi:MAG: hypothetical protein QOJ41_2037, partial [Acidobacteriaceae bacterium]|nr:hypothetical protein [Acidobacteriaceae bacterium]
IEQGQVIFGEILGIGGVGVERADRASSGQSGGNSQGQEAHQKKGSRSFEWGESGALLLHRILPGNDRGACLGAKIQIQKY